MTTQKFNELLNNIHDEQCFKILHDTYYPYIIKYGLIIYRNRDVAEDIAQDIFHYLLTHKISTEIRKPYVWLYTIVKNYFTKYKTDTVSIDTIADIPNRIEDYIYSF